MPDLKRTRNQLKTAIGALLVVDAIAIAMLLTPIAGMRQARQQQIDELRQEIKQREFAPWRGLDKKIPQARQQIEEFYDERFPTEESAVDADLGRIAQETGVRVSGIKWKPPKDAPVDGLQRVDIAANLSGDYLQLVRFINALERNQLFFLVEGVELGNEKDGIVALQITLATYMRSA
jgi:type IV pilus assembly protein PilO